MTATEDDSIPNEEITDPGSRQEDLTEQKSGINDCNFTLNAGLEFYTGPEA